MGTSPEQVPIDASIVDRYLESLELIRQPPSLEFLSSIIAAHIGAYAFSSVGPQLGDELPLDIDSLFSRIVERRRGGYCFEQNGLLFPVLVHLGFDAEISLARVMLSGAEHPGLTHRISIVTLDGVPNVADVGFGATGPPRPIPLPGNHNGDADTAPHRVVEWRPGQFCLELVTPSGPVPQYRFERVQYGASDCEMGHFFSHRHPDATFVNNLVVSRILPGEIRSLRNLVHRVITDGAEVEIPVTDAIHLRQILDSQFGLSVTIEEGARLFSAVASRLS